MVFGKNFLSDICNHVVPVDFPKVEDWSTIEPGMEIFITDQYGEFINSDVDGNIRVALLGEWSMVNSELKTQANG